jgi:hypothetical protein
MLGHLSSSGHTGHTGRGMRGLGLWRELAGGGRCEAVGPQARAWRFPPVAPVLVWRPAPGPGGGEPGCGCRLPGPAHSDCVDDDGYAKLTREELQARPTQQPIRSPNTPTAGIKSHLQAARSLRGSPAGAPTSDFAQGSCATRCMAGRSTRLQTASDDLTVVGATDAANGDAAAVADGQGPQGSCVSLDAEPALATLERERLARMERNKRLLADIGVASLASELAVASAGSAPKGKTTKRAPAADVRSPPVHQPCMRCHVRR